MFTPLDIEVNLFRLISWFIIISCLGFQFGFYAHASMIRKIEEKYSDF